MDPSNRVNSRRGPKINCIQTHPDVKKVKSDEKQKKVTGCTQEIFKESKRYTNELKKLDEINNKNQNFNAIISREAPKILDGLVAEFKRTTEESKSIDGNYVFSGKGSPAEVVDYLNAHFENIEKTYNFVNQINLQINDIKHSLENALELTPFNKEILKRIFEENKDMMDVVESLIVSISTDFNIFGDLDENQEYIGNGAIDITMKNLLLNVTIKDVDSESYKILRDSCIKFMNCLIVLQDKLKLINPKIMLSAETSESLKKKDRTLDIESQKIEDKVTQTALSLNAKRKHIDEKSTTDRINSIKNLKV